MQLIHSLTNNQIDQLHALYQNEYWSIGRSLEDTHRCAEGSSILFAFVEDEELKAFARVVTDYIFKAFVFDVIVAPSERTQGLGKKIISTIVQHPQLQKVKHIELYCLPELSNFYNQFGFTDDTGDMQLMRRDRDFV